MDKTDLWDLPMLVGEQYMLTSVLRETRDTILYRGAQRELRREVMVEVLRKGAASVPRKVQLFLDTARVQAEFQGEHLLRVLEVMEAEGTWVVAKESPEGEPLDMVQSDGQFLSAQDMDELMILLCHLCLRLDAEHVASAHFHLEDLYYHDHHFQLANPALAGTRSSVASRQYLNSAARELLPLLDMQSEKAPLLAGVLRRLSEARHDSLLQPALYMAEFSRLATLMVAATMKPV